MAGKTAYWRITGETHDAHDGSPDICKKYPTHLAHRHSEKRTRCLLYACVQDYYTSHQWLRELRRWKPGPLVAVYFHLDDDEIVECGPYWEVHHILPAVEAVRLFRQQSDTQGWEIVVPRSIVPRDIHKVRTLSQVLGWRYFLLDSPSNDVLEALADLLGIYKGRAARQLLQEINIRREERMRMGDEKAD